MIGIGTIVNVAAVLLGSTIGALVGHRLPLRTRDVVTDGLGLVTLLIAASSAVAVSDPALVEAVGDSAPMLIVLGAVLLGSIVGSLARVEDRLESLGDRIKDRFGAHGQDRFVEGFVTSSLVFCVGPLTLLGALNEGLGRGPDQLLLKSALDGFGSIAFAAAFGWGVSAAVVTLVAVQGGLTLVGVFLGDVLPDAHLAALTATGGILLVAVAIRLLDLKRLKVGDLLPALVVAPLLTAVVVAFR